MRSLAKSGYRALARRYRAHAGSCVRCVPLPEKQLMPSVEEWERLADLRAQEVGDTVAPLSPPFILSPGYVRVLAYAKSLMDRWCSSPGLLAPCGPANAGGWLRKLAEPKVKHAMFPRWNAVRLCRREASRPLA